MTEKYLKLARYIVSGGTAAVVNIALLYLLTEFAGVWYLLASIMSFVAAFLVSFVLQKFWTFGDHSREGAHKQLAIYLTVALINAGLNTLFIYSLVEYLGVWYIWSQIISSGAIALYSFFIYKLIFYVRPRRISLGLKALILTQKVDSRDDVLGFMHGWIAEFAGQCDKVTVICLQEGKHELPANVSVLSLGKPASRLKYLFNFYKYIWQERKNYDAVFVHMNPEYILFGWPVWKILGKKISLWYAHGYVPWRLRVAEKLTDIIFTSTKSGCRLASRKIKVIGQGIDIDKFKIQNSKFKIDNSFKIVSVGRISPVKDYETLISAAEVLKNGGLDFKIDVIGGAGLPDQEAYLTKIKKIVYEKKLSDSITFLGSKPNNEILENLAASDLFVNTSRTGSLDKAILEAMSAGLPILTCNEALKEVLGGYKDKLMFPKGDFPRLAEKIKWVMSLSLEERKKVGEDMRSIVARDHSLKFFISEILNILK